MLSGKDAVKFSSFSFNNIDNVTRQGVPVPIVYGKAFIGSVVVGAGLDVDEVII